MLRRKATLILLALAVPVIALTGCGKKDVVVVNGEKMTKDEYISRLERLNLGGVTAGEAVLRQAITEKLITQFAAKEKVQPTDAQIKARMDYYYKLSGQDAKAFLSSRGLTDAEFRQMMTVEQAQSNLICKDANVSDADAKAEYDRDLASPTSQYKIPEQIKLCVVVSTDKAKIDQAYDRLKKGEAFASVVKACSDDGQPSKSKAGLLGWFSRDGASFNGNQRVGMADKVLVDTAFALAPQAYSAPFAIVNPNNAKDVSWVIARNEQLKQEKVLLTFDEAKPFVKAALAARSAQDPSWKNDYINFVKSANVTVGSDRYKNLPKDIKSAVEKNSQGGQQKPATP